MLPKGYEVDTDTTRIDLDYVWLKGANKQYLDRFPQF